MADVPKVAVAAVNLLAACGNWYAVRLGLIEAVLTRL
jgi:hypothetical protein